MAALPPSKGKREQVRWLYMKIRPNIRVSSVSKKAGAHLGHRLRQKFDCSTWYWSIA